MCMCAYVWWRCALSDWDHEEECREKKSVRAVVCFGNMHNGDWVGSSAGHRTFNVQSVYSIVIKNSASSAIRSLYYDRNLTPRDTQIQGVNPEVNNHFSPGGRISRVS
ncbi:hypothetical protein AMECASPLE_034471 [Ameca splendens]|uniref:Uncharacterized protein n=1 Tax=Ameca splendens TaxID=208324 RepID=A0ABV0Z522_9TELE